MGIPKIDQSVVGSVLTFDVPEYPPYLKRQTLSVMVLSISSTSEGSVISFVRTSLFSFDNDDLDDSICFISYIEYVHSSGVFYLVFTAHFSDGEQVDVDCTIDLV